MRTSLATVIIAYSCSIVPLFGDKPADELEPIMSAIYVVAEESQISPKWEHEFSRVWKHVFKDGRFSHFEVISLTEEGPGLQFIHTGWKNAVDSPDFVAIADAGRVRILFHSLEGLQRSIDWLIVTAQWAENNVPVFRDGVFASGRAIEDDNPR